MAAEGFWEESGDDGRIKNEVGEKTALGTQGGA